MQVRTKRFSFVFCMITVVVSFALALFLSGTAKNGGYVKGAGADLTVTYEKEGGGESGEYGLTVELPAGYAGSVQYWIKTGITTDAGSGLDVSGQISWRLAKSASAGAPVWFEVSDADLIDSEATILARINDGGTITQILGEYNVFDAGKLKINTVLVGAEEYSGKLLYAQKIGLLSFDVYSSLEGADYTVRLKGAGAVLDSSVAAGGSSVLSIDTGSFAAGAYTFEITAEKSGQTDTAEVLVYLYDEFNAQATPVITDMQFSAAGNLATYKLFIKYADGTDIAYTNDADFLNAFDVVFISDGYRGVVVPEIKHSAGKVVSVDFALDYSGTGIYNVESSIARKGMKSDDRIIRSFSNSPNAVSLTRTDANGRSFNKGQLIQAVYSAEITGVDGNDIEYAFFREDAAGWTMIRGYKSAADGGGTLSWTPSRAGYYNIAARARCAGSATYELELGERFAIGENELLKGSVEITVEDIENGWNVEAGLIAGKPYKISAEYVNGGAESYNADELLYMFTLTSKNTNLIYLNKYTPDGSIVFIPNKYDDYMITARVIQPGTFGYMEKSQPVILKSDLLKTEALSGIIDLEKSADTVSFAKPLSIIGEVKGVVIGGADIFTLESGGRINVDKSAVALLAYGDYTAAIRTEKTEYSISAAVVSKVIRTGEELANLKDYGEITDYTAEVGAGLWVGPQYKLNGYFVLGGNINLTGEVVATDFYGTHGPEAKPYGFTGIFDGRGYTVIGGTYKKGGLFGSVGGGAEVKNTAFIDVALDGNYASVIGRMFHGKLSNILIDVATVTAGSDANENYAIARTIAEARLENCFVYYPVRATTTNFSGTYAYYLFGTGLGAGYTSPSTGSNIYSVGGNGGEISTTDFASFARNRFAFGTTNTQILAGNANAFNGFDKNIWNFDGAKASFNSIKRITSTAAYELYGSLNGSNERQLNTAAQTIDLTADMGSGVIPSDLTWTLKAKNNPGASIDMDSYLSVAPGGKGIVLSGLAGVVAEGEYALTGSADDNAYAITLPLTVASKIITSAEDLLNMKYYGEITDETTFPADAWAVGPCYKLNGCFVLGGNIDLSGETVATPFFGMNNSPEAGKPDGRPYGLTGIFDGRGYTVYGGTYKLGGLFGAVAVTGVVKNTAFVNVALLDNYASVIGRLFHGNLENVLIDIISVTNGSQNGHAVARGIGNATLTNCFVYYPNIQTIGSYANYVFNQHSGNYPAPQVKGENLYSIGGHDGQGNNGNPCNPTFKSSDFITKNYVVGTTNTQILAGNAKAFDGFDLTMWNFSGTKARFNSKTDI